MKHFSTHCYWCKKELLQRCDTYKSQLSKYGHSCCKHCFGNEQTFKDARTIVMTENNPFKGKSHSQANKEIMSQKGLGRIAWNKGMRKTKQPIIPGSIKKWMGFKNQFLADFGESCFKCGSKNRLEVHHIASKKRYPDVYYQEENCLPLCYWCHKEFHKKYTIKFFKPEDTFTWLNEGRQEKDFVMLH